MLPEGDSRVKGGLLGLLLMNRLGGPEEASVVFAQGMVGSIRQGLPLAEALVLLEEQSASQDFRQWIQRIRGSMQQGGSLLQALAPHPQTFDPLSLGILEAGERTGHLLEAWERLVDVLRWRRTIITKVAVACAYPVIATLMTVGMLALLGFGVWPLLSKGGIALDFSTAKPVLLIAAFMIVLKISSKFIILWIFRRCILATDRGRRWWDRFLWSLPHIGDMIALGQCACFFAGLQAAQRSGFSRAESVTLALGGLNHTLSRSHYESMLPALRGGESLGVTLKQLPRMPQQVNAMLAGQEETTEDMPGAIVQQLERQIDCRIEALARMIQPVLLVVLSVLVGSVLLLLFVSITRT